MTDNTEKNTFYLGWRGLGPYLGTRYYLSLENNTIQLSSLSPLKGKKLNIFPATAIVCTNSKRPSLAYIIFGTIVGFFGDIGTFKSSVEILSSDGLLELLIFLLLSLLIAVVFGTIIDRLYNRASINVILEGGTNLGTFTNFKNKLPDTVKAISTARGGLGSESMSSKRPYYRFLARTA